MQNIQILKINKIAEIVNFRIKKKFIKKIIKNGKMQKIRRAIKKFKKFLRI